MKTASKDLKEKIANFIRINTPKGAKMPLGIGWSLWNSFSMTEDESRTFLEDESFFDWIYKKCGTMYTYRSIATNSLEAYPELSKIVLNSKSKKLSQLKPVIINQGLYKDILSEEIINLEPEVKSEYIKICDISDVHCFLNDKNDKVRIEAYKRIGVISSADKMIKDKSAKVRLFICQVLPYGHPAFELLINDRSKWVFAFVARKINKGKIPLLLGSRHISDPFISSILKKRMINKGES
jgi:hypothetical protein